ncbi:putative lipoprotein [Escherichia coli]|nr:putative lipoprotein [Escherichia coli]
MKKRHLLSLLALGISTACYGETYPAPIGPSQSDFGGVGLLQTPTARMAREGELSLNYRDNDQYRYYSASVQLFPWLENNAALHRRAHPAVQQRRSVLWRSNV